MSASGHAEVRAPAPGIAPEPAQQAADAAQAVSAGSADREDQADDSPAARPLPSASAGIPPEVLAFFREEAARRSAPSAGQAPPASAPAPSAGGVPAATPDSGMRPIGPAAPSGLDEARANAQSGDPGAAAKMTATTPAAPRDTPPDLPQAAPSAEVTRTSAGQVAAPVARQVDGQVPAPRVLAGRAPRGAGAAQGQAVAPAPDAAQAAPEGAAGRAAWRAAVAPQAPRPKGRGRGVLGLGMAIAVAGALYLAAPALGQMAPALEPVLTGYAQTVAAVIDWLVVRLGL